MTNDMHTSSLLTPARSASASDVSSAAAPFTADDPRATLAAAVGIARTVVDGVRPSQLADPTPCDEMDVRALLGHSVAVLRRVAAIGRGGEAMAVPQVVTDIADDGWSAAYLEAAHETQAAWTDDARLDVEYALPWATRPGRDHVMTYASEVCAHAWDLAVATGQQPAWDDALLGRALAHMQVELPADRRRLAFEAMRHQLPPHMQGMNPPFDEVVAVDDAATSIDRLVGWYGRDPHWSPSA